MDLSARFARELPTLGLPTGKPGPEVTEADLAGLPEPAQRCLRYLGVVGRPRDWSFRLSFEGRFKLGPDKPWLPCVAWQYDTSPAVNRIFLMRLKLHGLPLIGRDTYQAGHGRLRVRALDLVTVADGSGPEFDLGELVTYLNDLVLLAPSMLLVPAVTFSPVDEGSFALALTDQGLTVRARVFVDAQGAPVNFETDDRFLADAADPKKTRRARWQTPMEGWHEVGGRRVPARGLAVWKLPEGDFTYADFRLVPQSLAFNVAPGDALLA